MSQKAAQIFIRSLFIRPSTPPPSHQFRQHIEVQDPDQKTLKPMIDQGLKDPTPGPFQ